MGASICRRAPTRRFFLTRAVSATAGAAALASDDFPAWQHTWHAAVRVLARNIRPLPAYQHPVLWESSTYEGVWQECGPHEGLTYAALSPHISSEGGANPKIAARNNHMAFFALQRPDGQLPACLKRDSVGFGQIQMVVPIAATAWELAQLLGDEELLATAYAACKRWDGWLRRYRDTRKTGLVEGFCTYDTGMDNSPRWAGMPNQCPNGDARQCPPIASLPRLCPDVSVTTYGGRVALANMAVALGKAGESARWQADAESIRQLIIEKLYSPEAAAFYDLDAQNKDVGGRSVVITRVLGEHVLKLSDRRDEKIFESIWNNQVHNREAFWTPYPFPSTALNDPAFVRPIPRNSWGGPSQALTALRATRWMPHYGKQAELNQLMRQWCEAIVRDGDFRQQMDPVTGKFTQPDLGGYSPAALLFLDFARRLY